MPDIPGLISVFLAILIILVVLGIILRWLNPLDRQIEVRQVNATPVPFEDARFMDAFMKPVYEDGLEFLEDAVDSIKTGFDIYEHGAYVEASGEFRSAVENTDEASRKFRELLAMVENQDATHIRNARRRLVECKRLRQGAKDLEAACDAMMAGSKDEAQALIDGARNVRKLVDEWKKD